MDQPYSYFVKDGQTKNKRTVAASGICIAFWRNGDWAFVKSHSFTVDVHMRTLIGRYQNGMRGGAKSIQSVNSFYINLKNLRIMMEYRKK